MIEFSSHMEEIESFKYFKKGYEFFIPCLIENKIFIFPGKIVKLYREVGNPYEWKHGPIIEYHIEVYLPKYKWTNFFKKTISLKTQNSILFGTKEGVLEQFENRVIDILTKDFDDFKKEVKKVEIQEDILFYLAKYIPKELVFNIKAKPIFDKKNTTYIIG